MSNFLIGNTINLQVQFLKRSDGVTPVEASDVYIKVYDSDRNQIGSTILVGEEYKVSTGLYSYNYTIPNNPPFIDIEWVGITEGLADVSRDRIEIDWFEQDTNTIPAPTLTEGTNTYITLEDANEYFLSRLSSDIWEGSSDVNKAKALIQATRNIDKLIFKGSKTVYGQPLAFPRTLESHIPDYIFTVTEEIPQIVKDACCEEAIMLLDNLVNPNTRYELQKQGVKQISFGHASETYVVSNSIKTVMNAEVLSLLKGYIASSVTIQRRR